MDVLPLRLSAPEDKYTNLYKRGQIQGADYWKEVTVEFDKNGIPSVGINISTEGDIVKQIHDIISDKDAEILYTRYNTLLTDIIQDVVPEQLTKTKFIQEYLNSLLRGFFQPLFLIAFDTTGKFNPQVVFEGEMGAYYGTTPIKGDLEEKIMMNVEDAYGLDNDIVIYNTAEYGGPRVVFNRKLKYIVANIQVQGKKVIEKIPKGIEQIFPEDIILPEEVEQELERVQAAIIVPEGFEEQKDELVSLSLGLAGKPEQARDNKIQINKREHIIVTLITSHHIPTSIIRVWTGQPNLVEEAKNAFEVSRVFRTYYTDIGYKRTGVFKLKTTPIFLPYIKYTAARCYTLKISITSKESDNADDEAGTIKDIITSLRAPLPKTLSPSRTEEIHGTFGPYVLRIYVASTLEETIATNALIDEILEPERGVNQDIFVPVILQAESLDEFIMLPSRASRNPKFVKMIVVQLINLYSGLYIYQNMLPKIE